MRKLLTARSYAVASRALIPARRFRSASRRRSAASPISARPSFKCPTMSNRRASELGRRRHREPRAADREMQAGPLALGQRRVGGLLHAVVTEREPSVDERRLQRIHVDAFEARQRHDEPRLDCGPQALVRRRRRLLLHVREQAQLEPAADDGRDAQRRSRALGQPLQLRRQELGDVLRDRGALDCRDVVAEPLRRRVEGDEPGAVQRLQELPHEERVAARLLLNDLRERHRRRGVLVQSVGDELRHLGNAERRELDRLHRHALFSLLLDGQHERMVGRHLGVAIREHEQQRLRRASRHDSRDEVQARRVGPLHVVEKQHERMRLLAEQLHEVLERQMKAVLGLETPRAPARAAAGR